MSTGKDVNIELDDFVCFERIGADREWKNTLGKVVGFPTSTRLRVELFDRVEHVPQSTALMEAKLQEVATANDRLALWEEKQELEHELQQAVEAEDKASEQLFRLREVTQQRLAQASANTRETMEALDSVRDAITRVPPRQWRDIRAPGRPTESSVSIARALMLALNEDRATSWEAMQAVMREPDFMERIMHLDCTATPLPKACRKKIMAELGIRRRDSFLGSIGGNSVRREKGKHQRVGAPQEGTQLEVAIRSWIIAQITCSEAREAQELVLDESFKEYQDQSNLVREVNVMRENISALQEKIMEKKLAICGDTPLATLLLKDAETSPDSLFYKRMANGRHVTDMILRDSVLVVFGSKAEEEEEGDSNAVFVRLSPEEVAQLMNVVRARNDVHDLNEMETLLALSESDELEIRELTARMDELRRKDDFTEEDEEEMRQLDIALKDLVRRHETTQWRLAKLRSAGRDKLYLEACRQRDMVESDLHLMFSGDLWGELLENEEHRENMEKAFCSDLSRALGLPTENMRNTRFALGPLLVDVTVKHSSDVTREQLQGLANDADFPELCAYYERVTGKKAFPLNTPAQRSLHEAFLHRQRMEENFGGGGLKESLDSFADDSEGETDDENYRRPQVEIPTVRNEYGAEARYGIPILAHEGVPVGFDAHYEAVLKAKEVVTLQEEAEPASEQRSERLQEHSYDHELDEEQVAEDHQKAEHASEHLQEHLYDHELDEEQVAEVRDAVKEGKAGVSSFAADAVNAVNNDVTAFTADKV